MDIKTIDALCTTLDGIGDADDREITAGYIADLRRQIIAAELERDAAQDAVVGLQGERSALRALLETERHRSSIAKAEAADLRRQLDEARLVSKLGDAAVTLGHAEVLELRQRLADCQAKKESETKDFNAGYDSGMRGDIACAPDDAGAAWLDGWLLAQYRGGDRATPSNWD